MNRCIRYRAFHKIEKKIYDVAGIACGNSQVLFFDVTILTVGAGNREPEILHVEKDAVEIMQYTGLHDVHQTPIYEDDLLRNEAGEIVRVQWVDSLAGFACHRIGDTREPSPITQGIIDKEKFVVFGNYYLEAQER